MNGRPCVGLNFRLAHAGWLGGFYYLQNLARALSRIDDRDGIEVVGLVPVDDPALPVRELDGLLTVVGFNEGNPRRALAVRVSNRVRRTLAPFRRGHWGLGAAVAEADVDVLFPAVDEEAGTAARPLPWVYDLQHLRFPENFSQRELAKRTLLFGRIAGGQGPIVVSSAVAGGELEASFPAAAGKTRVLRFTTVPAADWLWRDPRATVRRRGLPERFALVANQFWVHKDHRTAFEAVRILRDRGTVGCLVCTGATSDPRHPGHFEALRSYVAEQGLDERVHILGAVPRSDYVDLLRAATLVLQPSLYEGWSSILEDARALGKAVVASDIAVHREQAPDGIRFFVPSDAEALANTLGAAFDASDGARPEATEEEALARHEERVRGYARTFVTIVKETAARASA